MFEELLAIAIHESGRASVAAGHTLAAHVGQPRPFVEWDDLPEDVREGRRMTAGNLLRQVEFFSPGWEKPTGEQVLFLAQALHLAEREAIERGLVAVKLDPPCPWIPFLQLPFPARHGRMSQARHLLQTWRIEVTFPLPNVRSATDAT